MIALELYAKIADAIGIKYNIDFWCEEEKMHMIDAINQWWSLNRWAARIGIAWKIGDYDPIKLKATIINKTRAT